VVPGRFCSSSRTSNARAVGLESATMAPPERSETAGFIRKQNVRLSAYGLCMTTWTLPTQTARTQPVAHAAARRSRLLAFLRGRRVEELPHRLIDDVDPGRRASMTRADLSPRIGPGLY
jgi:hypothetical protein